MADFRDRVVNAAEFCTGLHLLLPGATAREVQRFFGPKTDLRQVANWKKGERWPPDWAVQLLQSELDKLSARAQTVRAHVRSGPGRKGTRANLKPFRQAA